MDCTWITIIDKIPIVNTYTFGSDMVPSIDMINTIIHSLLVNTLKITSVTYITIYNKYCIGHLIRLVLMICYYWFVPTILGGSIAAMAIVQRLLPGLISSWKAGGTYSVIGVILILTTLFTYFSPLIKQDFVEMLTKGNINTQILINATGATILDLSANDLLKNIIMKYYKQLEQLGITKETIVNACKSASEQVSKFLLTTTLWGITETIRANITSPEDIWEDRDFNLIYSEYLKKYWEFFLINVLNKHHSVLSFSTDSETNNALIKTNKFVTEYNQNYSYYINKYNQQHVSLNTKRKGSLSGKRAANRFVRKDFENQVKRTLEQNGQKLTCNTDRCKLRIPSGLMKNNKVTCLCEGKCSSDWLGMTKFGSEKYCVVNKDSRYCGYDNGPDIIDSTGPNGLSQSYARCNPDTFKPQYACDTIVGYKYCEPNSDSKVKERVIDEPWKLNVLGGKRRSAKRRSAKRRSAKRRSAKRRSAKRRSTKRRSTKNL